MEEKIYIVINESDAYRTVVHEFENVSDVEDYIKGYEINDIKVFSAERLRVEKSVKISLI